MRLTSAAQSVIEYSFYILFFLVPIFWLPVTSELFEFNKLILVYLLTIVIVGSWVIKGILEKNFVIVRSPLDIFLLIFLLANFLSTIFSIDPHTSVYGYYGRFHGGLLSTIAYTFLYFALVSNTNKKLSFYYLLTILASGFLVAFYGVLQHPNPFFAEQLGSQTIFHGIDYNYWAVDVENRVFSTLGQPNWLAAFLAMLIFPLLSLIFTFKKTWQKLILFGAFIFFYLAFTFTYSRGGLLGLIAGSVTFLALLPLYKRTWWQKFIEKISLKKVLKLKKTKVTLGVSVLIFLVLLVSNFYFGNALSRRGGLTPKVETTPASNQTPQQTTLEEGGQETAEIRTIVWKGSLEIFKNFPIFGSGVETFGYSYYLFKPLEHNLTLEWDYLYNKAHNEYLNFLATTGTVGTLSYLALIGAFQFFALRFVLRSSKSSERLVGIGFLAGYNSYLVQNFFGFSVVPISVLFFLFPALFFSLTNTLPKKTLSLLNEKRFVFLKNHFYQYSLVTFVLIISIFLFLSTLSLWTADFFYNKSLSSNSYEESINNLETAINLNKGEPLYKAELAVNLSGLSYGLRNDEKQTAQVKDYNHKASELINNVVAENPNNTALWQTKRVVDFNIARVDKGANLELLETAEKLKELAPNDASIQYDVALVYSFLEDYVKPEEQLEKVLKLKKDYQEVVILLSRTYVHNDKFEEAVNLLRKWVELHPDDTEATELLKTLFTS